MIREPPACFGKLFEKQSRRSFKLALDADERRAATAECVCGSDYYGRVFANVDRPAFALLEFRHSPQELAHRQIGGLSGLREHAKLTARGVRWESWQIED